MRVLLCGMPVEDNPALWQPGLPSMHHGFMLGFVGICRKGGLLLERQCTPGLQVYSGPRVPHSNGYAKVWETGPLLLLGLLEKREKRSCIVAVVDIDNLGSSAGG